MPGIVPHMIVAKLVSEKLGVEPDDVYRGSLLPDILKDDKRKNHYKKQGEHFLIPSPEEYKEKNDINNPLYLGYYTHLALDKYFLEEYIPKYIKKYTIFDDLSIYKDYDHINYELIKRFNLDKEKLKNILQYKEYNVNEEKLSKNIDQLFSIVTGPTIHLNAKHFGDFLEEISNRIITEIK